jgi:3-dehydro-L-gulonate 2-dehydrogenase
VISSAISQIIADYHSATPEKGGTILYPGEKVMKTRNDNTANGIPVLKSIWEEITSL